MLSTTSPGRPLGAHEAVSSDFAALASHMHACSRAQGRLFQLRYSMESLHSLVTSRLVSTAALFALVGIGLLTIA